MAQARASFRAVAIGALTLAAAACAAITPLDESLGAGVINRDPATDVYGLTVSGGIVRSAAPSSNKGSGMRVVFWRKADAATTDQESCATWSAKNHQQQPGIALRVHEVRNGVRAITITKNVWLTAYSVVNVHVMDSTSATEPFVKIAGQDLPGLRNSADLTDVKPYPWRSCAQVVGSTVSLKVWPAAQAEPAWDDPNYGYSVDLPAGWGAAGRPGFYIGHLPPGRSLDHSDLAVSDLATTRTAEPTTTPRSPTHILLAP